MVRKLLNEHDIDPSSLTGTGLGGRITRSDVDQAIAGLSTSSHPDAAGAPAAVPSIAERPPAQSVGTSAEVRAPGASAGDEIVPFTNIRRRTAEHMVRSKATSAHTLMVKEIDYERVEQVRRLHGDRFKSEEGFGLPICHSRPVPRSRRWQTSQPQFLGG